MRRLDCWLGPLASWAVISAVLVGSAIPTSLLMRRCYGSAAGRRFALATASALGAQQIIVGLALQRGRRSESGSGRRTLDLVDVLTLSRGGAAAVLLGLLASGVRDRRGPAGWLGWGTLLPSVTLTDWIDGPLARRRGPTELGRVLDLEADSWLTLCASVAGVAWGGLPPYYPAAPAARYLLPLLAARRGVYARFADQGTSWWSRTTGIAQMAVLIAALAPFSGSTIQWITRSLARLISPLQLLSLAILAGTFWKTPMGDDLARR